MLSIYVGRYTTKLYKPAPGMGLTHVETINVLDHHLPALLSERNLHPDNYIIHFVY